MSEALLAAWCLGSAVLMTEIVQVAAVRSLHLSGLALDLALGRVWGVYALAFGAVGLCAWIATLPFRRLAHGRLGALLFLFLAGSLPSVLYPVLVPSGGRPAGSFLGAPPRVCALLLGFGWLAAAGLSSDRAWARKLRGPHAAWSALAAALTPFLASALVVTRTFSFANAEGRPLAPDGTAFRVLQVLAVLLPGGLCALGLVRSVSHAAPVPGTVAWRGGWARALALLALGLVAVVVAGRLGLRRWATVARAERPASVLLIVIDTLRADALSMYGGPPEDTPHLERLRRDSVLFEACVAPAPWTLPSFASLFTSTYPSEHLAGARFPGNRKRMGPIPAGARTIAEALHEAGFRTAASLTNSNLERVPGIDRGFERFSNGHSLYSYHPTSAWVELELLESKDWYPRAELQTHWILDELALASRDPRPFFLLGHYTDPHIPYQSPARFLPKVAGEITVRERYRAEVRYVDHGLGELFEELRERDLYDDLLIVVTADHGEELDELRRGRKRVPSTGVHGHTLFQEQLHVPLLVKLPGGRLAGTTRAERVSLLDLAPTILAQLQLDVPASFRGWDLFDEANAPRYAQRVVLAEAVMRREEQRAGFRGDLKVVLPDLPPAAEGARVFRLGDDPAERAPGDLQGEAASEIYEALLAHLRFWSAKLEDGADEVRPDPALLQHLEALGYTE